MNAGLARTFSLSVPLAFAFGAAGLAAVSACAHEQREACAPDPAPVASAGDARALVTIVYTSDEHGWFLGSELEARRWGGAGPFLAALHALGHCDVEVQRDVAFTPLEWKLPAPVAAGLTFAPAHAGAATSCPKRGAATLLLSGGDNFTGPAASGFFRGETMAAAMARLGYDASAFGNHEFDFGRAQLERNRAVSGMPYVAANMQKSEGGATPWAEPSIVLERGGLRIGVVGLATSTTPQVAMAKNLVGIRFEDEEQALVRAVPELWARGVDAVVLIAHACHDVIAPIVERHPEWHLAFAGTGHCHREEVELRAGVPVIAPGWRLEHFGHIELAIDRAAKDPEARAHVVGYELREVTSAVNEPVPSVDPAFDARLAGWSAEVEQKLGEVIGWSAAGQPKKSAALGQWMTRAWREAFHADVAITTQGAIRQELPAGAIRKSTVLGIMPFENDLVVCRIPGAALAAMLREPKALVAGLRCKAGSCTHEDGAPLDPTRSYRVVTTDFLFYGGDGFRFAEYDAAPELTGVNWREPVMAWTKAHAPDAEHTLESALGSP